MCKQKLVAVYAKKIRISQEKHLSSGFQNSDLQKEVFNTTTCMLRAFPSHVYRCIFWKPDDRCFSWQILNYLMYIKTQEQESPWNFCSRLKILGAHCVWYHEGWPNFLYKYVRRKLIHQAIGMTYFYQSLCKYITDSCNFHI